MAAGAVAGAASEPNAVTGEDETLAFQSGANVPGMGMQHGVAGKWARNGAISGMHFQCP